MPPSKALDPIVLITISLDTKTDIPKEHFRINYKNNLYLSSLGIGSY